ncbi:LPD38 domain-containing protein [Aeromonas veronii]|uniref:LPD38 domain-containing protein n=1 Tax=Aeromonas veronii TaxID=654 RepID=UPI0031FC2649
MDKPGLRDALPQPKLSDTRTDPFWSNLDSSLSAAAAPSAAKPPQRDLNVGLGDVARGVGAGALELVGGIGELARQASQFGKENAGKQGGDYLEQARANMANKLSPVLDVVAGAGDLAKSGAESLTEGMSGDAKEAIGRSLIDETPEGRLTMGDGAGDLDVWAMKMAQGVGSMVPTLLAGGVTGAAAKASIGRAVTTSMIKRGATQEVAEAVAAKTVAKLATGAAVTTGATGSVGSAGVNTRESVLGMSFDELSRSDTFRQAFTRIDQDQQTQHLSDEEKLSLAREETANVASRATMSDAKVWGAAAMGSVMGDAMLFKMLAGKAATGGVLKGAAKGAVGEGIGETLEEGVQQYTINESLNEVAAADIDPMKGVVSSALEGGLIGMGTGGALGGMGGLRGGKSQPESEGTAQVDPATVEDVAPVESGDPVQVNPAASPADPDLAPAADAMADQVVAPSGEQSPLGPSASQFDELRDVPAYLRRDDTADRFKGMAADSEVQRALAGEFGQSVQELVASQMQAGDQGKSLYERAQAGELGLDPFAGNKSAQQVAMENQRPALPLKDVIFAGDANAARGMTKEGHFDDKQAGTGPQFRGAERTRWQSGQEGDVLPPEASSTKPAGELPGAVIDGEAREVGTELPHRDVVYGADQRQPDAKPMRGSATESAVGPLQTLRITRKGKPFATEKEAAMASRKGKEMPVPLNGGGFGVAEIAEVEQVKATNNSSAINGPQGNNQPQAEVSNEPVTPVPAISSEGQGDQPGAGEPAAAGAGPAIAGLADRAGSGYPADNTPASPVPNGQQQDDPTLTAPAPDAGAAVSGRIGEDELRDRDLLKEHNGRWKYRSAVGAGWFTANTKESAIERAEEAYRNGLAKGIPAPTRAERWAKEELEFAERMDGRFGKMTIPELEERHRKLGGAIADLQQAGRNEMDGNGGRRTGAAVASEGARQSGQEKMELERYIQLRRDRDTTGSGVKSQQIEAARAEVAPEPTDAQKEAGNYKKGHLKLQGLDIALENPKGSTRSGTDKDGKAWQSTMAHDYGYIKRTLGADGDHVDVFIGDQPDSETVYVVDQVDPKTGKFDEHKVMMGFADEQAAQAGYLANYEKGWKGLGSIKAMPVEEFKRWVKGGDTTKPVGEQPAAAADIGSLTDDEALAVADELGISHDDNPDDARWGLEGAKKDALSTAIERVRNPSSATPIKPVSGNSNIVSAPPMKDEGIGAKRAVSFSKQAMAQGEKPAKHLTRKEAELVTKEWFKQYRGASGIEVQIHTTQAELEQALGLAAKDGLIRRAAFDDDNGTLHVAADTIANPKRMREILRHEVLAHYGLANVLGDGEYTKLISRIIKSKSTPSMKAVWDWVDTHYAGEDVGVQAEEVIAHLAELEQSAWRRGWDQVVAWVTKALRTVGFVPGGITAAETRVLIEGLGKKMKRGGPDNGGPDGGHKFSQESEQPAKKGGLKMSQANTAADKAMEKLNLGPKPDIIDKTKANLDKLRKVDRGVVESWVDRFIKKANTEVLDALAPIKYAEDAAGITDAADSGYVAARMATGAASTMQATMLYGLPEWKDGVIQRKAGTGEKDALLGIFSDLGTDLHNWLGWMAGHRAELLMAQGRENLLDANDIAALKGQGKGKEAKFLDAKARWNRLNAATLDLAQEAGLFTAEARAEFENEWYIPFFRESDDGDVIAPFKPKGIANQNAGIKKLKGGEANTNDLLENIFTSTSKLIDASMKNMAAQKTVWNLADTGLIEVIPKPNKMDYQALANGKDRIMLKLEGEDYMIKVEDPDLYRAMTFFDRQPFGALVNVASKAKRILTIGITSSPEFMLRNFLRDSLSSWTISKDGFKPMIDSIKGVRKTWRMEGSTIDVMFSGASFLGGYVNGNDPGAMADAVRKSLRRKGMTPEQIAKHEKSIVRNAEHAKEILASVWDKYSLIGEAIENGNREAVYDAAIKAGKSHAQAAFESKDLMDFSMLGASRVLQTMTQVLPFFNARIQGLGKLTRELRDNPREIAKRAGMITAASLALLAYNWDDERYEALQDWEKDSYWHVWLDGQHWRIPKPFEIGTLFGTIPERIVRAMGDKDTGAKFGKAMVRAFGDTFAFNPIPQIIKPAVEASVNYDFFKGAPIDSPQDLAVQAEARYSEQTSLLMREIGELSGFSPKQLEHLLMGYTGTLGAYVMAAADGLIRASRPGESASWRADEIPLLKAVYRGSEPAKSTQHMEDFYQMLSEVNQLKRTVDQYRSEGLTDKANELLDDQGGILKSRRSLSRTQQQIRVLRNKIDLIQRDRTMNAEEKRKRIDELLARRNDLVYQAVNKNRENWE